MDCRLRLSRHFAPLIREKNRWLVLCGGAGSGESYFAAQKIILRIVAEPGHFFLVVRKIARTCRESVWSLLKSVIHDTGMGHLWTIHESDMKATYLPNGSRLICVGLDDPEKIKSIAGVTGLWEEEATELDSRDIDQLNLRLRGASPSYKQHIVTFNPISAAHWLKGRFFDVPPESCTIHRSTYRDNPFLDADYANVLEGYQDIDANYHRVYALGEWGVLEGLIYDPWPVLPDASWPTSFDETIYGLDFGFNNPSALVRLDLRDGAAYLTEVVYQSDLTTADLVDTMRREGVRAGDPIYADAAEPDRIEEIYRAGYNVHPADKGPGSVAAGIDTVKRSTIFSRAQNVNINREVGAYKWREDRSGKLLDEPAKLFDHAMDALRYAIHTHLGRQNTGFFIRALGGKGKP